MSLMEELHTQPAGGQKRNLKGDTGEEAPNAKKIKSDEMSVDTASIINENAAPTNANADSQVGIDSAGGIDLARVKRQIEYYLSDKNLQHDKFFHEKITQDPLGGLDITIVLSCKKIQELGATEEDVLRSMAESEVVEIIKNDQGLPLLKRKTATLPPLREPRGDNRNNSHRGGNGRNNATNDRRVDDVHAAGCIIRIDGIPEEASWKTVKDRLSEKMAALLPRKEQAPVAEIGFTEAQSGAEPIGKQPAMAQSMTEPIEPQPATAESAAEPSQPQSVPGEATDPTGVADTAEPSALGVAGVAPPDSKEKMRHNRVIDFVSMPNASGSCYALLMPFDDDRAILGSTSSGWGDVDVNGCILKASLVTDADEAMKFIGSLPPVIKKARQKKIAARRKTIAHKAIKVGDTEFHSIDHLRDCLKQVLKTLSVGKVVTKKSSEVLRALLAYHPSSESKLRDAVDFKVDVAVHQDDRQTRCFHVIRSDGSTEDFSYQKCIAELSRNPPFVIAEGDSQTSGPHSEKEEVTDNTETDTKTDTMPDTITEAMTDASPTAAARPSAPINSAAPITPARN